MDELKVDTETLRSTGAQLRYVAEQLQNAEADSENGAQACGHPEVARALRDFADQWTYRRGEMVASIAGLADATGGVGEAFARLDQELGATLRGSRS